MFYIVKSKQTDKCKVVHYLEEKSPSLHVVKRVSTDNKDFYRIQYHLGYWLMGYCDTKSNQFIGESNIFKVLEFQSEDACNLFLKIFKKSLNDFALNRNKATEVNI